jgi:ribose/xylose/arabinose/galactoside ABC-type transport system permease subunit
MKLNILVRSVALGIVAEGKRVIIASIDLSVAYTISITAVAVFIHYAR